MTRFSWPKLTWASFLLAAAGIVVAIYLVYVHYQEHALVCGLGNCEKVQTSKYAELAGIPIAWMGLAMYVGIALLLILTESRTDLLDFTTVALFGVTFAGTLFCGYFTYLELFTIHAVCQWCVSFAAITVLLFVISLFRLITLYRDPGMHS